MAYRVEFTPAAARDVRKLPKNVQRRVMARAKKLAEDPRPRGCTKLEGPGDGYRVREGDYRIVYRIEDGVLLVVVVRVRHRKEVYRNPAA